MQNNNDGCGCFLYAVLIIILIAMSIFFTMAIVNSDMPDWLKFLLLR